MFAGIDTSNYTTSVAVFDGEHIIQKKQLLIVKKGERGLRQSEALFQHTVNLPILINRLKEETGELNLEAIGVIAREMLKAVICLAFWQENRLRLRHRHFAMYRCMKHHIRLGTYWLLYILLESPN